MTGSAKQSSTHKKLDCFVASLLAMTTSNSKLALLRHAPCRAHPGQDRVQIFDHRRDLLPRDIERGHEAQRVRLRRVEQQAGLERLRHDRSADRQLQVERERQSRPRTSPRPWRAEATVASDVATDSVLGCARQRKNTAGEKQPWGRTMCRVVPFLRARPRLE